MPLNNYPPELECLLTVVQNNAGERLNFSFLPPRGKILEDGERFAFLGTFLAASRTYNSSDNQRRIAAFERAVRGGLLKVIHTPHPILYDAFEDSTGVVAIEVGILGVDDPCWDAFSGCIATEDLDCLATQEDNVLRVES